MSVPKIRERCRSFDYECNGCDNKTSRLLHFRERFYPFSCMKCKHGRMILKKEN